jgi:hypothetical protein
MEAITALCNTKNRKEGYLHDAKAALEQWKAKVESAERHVADLKAEVVNKEHHVAEYMTQIAELDWALALIERHSTVDKDFLNEVWSGESGTVPEGYDLSAGKTVVLAGTDRETPGQAVPHSTDPATS